jgi:hypothetical protein
MGPATGAGYLADEESLNAAEGTPSRRVDESADGVRSAQPPYAMKT